jgi:hypothetical protein
MAPAVPASYNPPGVLPVKTLAFSIAVALGVAGAAYATRLPVVRPVAARAVPAAAVVNPDPPTVSTPVIPITGAQTYPVRTGYVGPYSGGAPDLLDRPTARPINHKL